jgi:hypothetical protein
MPYKLEKNKDGSFKLINRETGHILAEHTSPERAMKQVKAIHAHKGSIANKYTKPKGMPKHHRIRKNIEILQNRIIVNPKHRKFVDLTKQLLKHEEKHGDAIWGGAWYDDLWSGVKDVLAFPADIIENVPFVKPALELGLTAVAPEALPFLEVGLQGSKMLFGDDTNKGLKEVWNPDSLPQESAPTPIPNAPTVADVVDETVQDIVDTSTPIPPRPQTAREEILNPYGSNQPTLYNPLQYLIASSNLAFPPTMNFDPREQPLGLQAFLASHSMAGVKVHQDEYNAIVRKQKPETWISFPNNGYYKRYPSYQTGIN